MYKLNIFNLKKCENIEIKNACIFVKNTAYGKWPGSRQECFIIKPRVLKLIKVISPRVLSLNFYTTKVI